MRHLFILAFVLSSLALTASYADEPDKDTAQATATRKKLKQKVSVEFKDTRIADAIDEIKEQIKGLNILLDTKGGVSRNQTITYKADDKPLDEVLDGMFKKNDLGYYVISQQNNAYNGALMITKGKARGYPLKNK